MNKIAKMLMSVQVGAGISFYYKHGINVFTFIILNKITGNSQFAFDIHKPFGIALCITIGVAITFTAFKILSLFDKRGD